MRPNSLEALALQALRKSFSRACNGCAQVLASDVGEVNQARLQLLFSLVGFLVQQEINDSVLKDGFPLPDIPHVGFIDPDLTFVQHAVKLAANVKYQP
jgi:hypothetical protein